MASLSNSVGYSEGLAIFEKPMYNAGTLKTRWVDYAPTTQLGENSTIEFLMHASPSSYIDLSRCYLCLKVKIVKEDGSSLPEITGANIPDEANVSPVNLWFHSLIEQADIFLQHTLVATSGPTYPYLAYLDTILRGTKDTLESENQAQLFYWDTAGAMEEYDVSTTSNVGLLRRHKYIRGSAIVDMQGRLSLDLFKMKRYLINNVEMSIKLTPSRIAFHLMSANSAPKYKLLIQEAAMRICHVSPIPQVLIAHQAVLDKDNHALYPYFREVVKRYVISSGSYHFTVDDAFQGVLPTRLVMGLVNSEASSGSFKKNPFNFQTYSVDFLSAVVDSASMPARPIQVSFDSAHPAGGNYLEAYMTLFRGRHIDSDIVGSRISRSDYSMGYTIYVLDLEPDMSGENDDMWPAPKKGNLRIEVRFATALPETVNLIMAASFPALLKIDKTRYITV